MNEVKCDVAVIGAGPGGYVSAIRAAQLGLNTVVVEREALGGVCLNVGCIPSKAMISAAHFLHRIQNDAGEMGIELKSPPQVNLKKMVTWKQSVCDRMSQGVAGLLKGNKVQVIKGDASFVTPYELQVRVNKKDTQSIKAKYYIIATGSRPIAIPGFSFDEEVVLSSTGALALNEIPEKLVVIGGGYIGLEISSYLAQLGSQVEILEAAPQLLAGAADPECVQVVQKRLLKKGIQLHLGAQATSYKKVGKKVEVSFKSKNQTTEEKIKADKILVTVGRKPQSDQLNLQKIGIQLDERGFIKVNEQRCTPIPHIFAIGDVAGGPMLAHKASYEGVMVAEILAGKNRAYDARTVPAVIFTDPEVASAGWTEEECKNKGYHQLKIGKFPFAANGRAVSMMETEGFVKIIADAATHLILGVHIVGPEASNLISEAVLAIEMGTRLEDIALSIHPHPTLGETMMEAAESALGHAIHVIQRPLSASLGKQVRVHA